MNSRNQPEVRTASSQVESIAVPQRASPSRHHSARRKVFFLVDSLDLGGTETQAVELAIRLDPARYEITLGCLKARGPLLNRLAKHPVTIREFFPDGGVDSIRGLYQIFRLARFLRRERFQIVHTHDLYSNLLGIPAAVVARVAVIISSQRDLGHLEIYRTRRRKWLRRLQKWSTVVLANANAVRESLLDETDFDAQKVRVVYNAVDLSRFERVPRDRSRIAPDAEDEKWIVLVGNMHSDVKGHPRLIDAAKDVVSEFPACRFVLVGDGKLQKEFESQVSRCGLERNFLFLGQRDDVPAILACCDIGLLPSKAEGFSNALLEYLAAGLPTVATRVGGIAEILRDGEEGLLIAPENSVALAKAILRLLRDPEFAKRLGENGKELVASRFSFDRMIAETDSLYTELLGSRGVE
ncbi:MAG: glycosyltransferase [Candidatus Sulfotelmatobacter sp.]